MANTNEAGEAWTRGFFGAVFDRLVAWHFGLRPEACTYKVRPLRIPIHEDISRIELAADLYEPIISDGAGPAGTILVRNPYGRGLVFSALFTRIYAARGYQVLFVSCRGTFGSGGEFDPWRTEIEDGKAVVEWMRKQPWYTGRFATLGASYLGFTQWALLMNPPEDMVAAIISVGPHDFHKALWGTGALNLDFVKWAKNLTSQEEAYNALKRIISSDSFEGVLDGIPLAQSVEAAFGGKTNWPHNWIKVSDPKDDCYTYTRLNQALERAKIPILLISGWYDLFQDQTMEQYSRLRERGCNVALTMGGGGHNRACTSREATKDTLSWLDEHLAQKGKTDRKAPMKYYVTGAEEWRYIADFPPPSSKSFTFYLDEENKLSTQKGHGITESTDFVFDPRDPTPTMGGNTLRKDAGKVDDTALAQRSDILAFTTESLTEDIELVGRASVELSHATDIPYADLFVRISEVNEKGRSYNISETYQRLDPARGPDPIVLPLSWCAHRFKKGKRLRLIIAGGSHPHHARNLGVHNPDNTASEIKAVKHTLFLRESRLVLNA